MNIAIVGSGAYADALGTLVELAGHSLSAPPAADLTVISVPPAEVRATITALTPGPATHLLIATRGLEPQTGKRFSTVVAEESACLRVAALGGPIVPSEVARRSLCAGVVASRFTEMSSLCARALHSPLCRIYESPDLADLELAGALIEVLAVGIGVARGLGLGVAAQATVATRGAAEGARLAKVEGGDPRTFFGLSGMGELIAVTGLEDHPANARGRALVAGDTDPALAELCSALLLRHRDLPITAGIHQLALGKISARALMEGLSKRARTTEWDP